MKPIEPPTPEELAEFHAAVAGVKPLNVAQRVHFEAPKPAPRPRQRELDEAAAIAESLSADLEIDDLIAIGASDSFMRSGISRKVMRDLRRGRWAIQSHTDLHGLNRYAAHAEVRRFLAQAKLDGHRCVRIVHGRGYGSPGREGVLRQLVKGWLARRQEVLAFCHAPSFDGGEGVLWVLLQAEKK